MDKIYAFIINFNRLDLPRKMADYLADGTDVIPIIVDNASTYPPLLEYYKTCPHIVEILPANYGPAGSMMPMLEKYNLHENFIFTDPDLDLSGIPKDFLHLLKLGLEKYSFATKAGFSLSIDNIPDTEMKTTIMQWELATWANKLDDQFYNAYIDTTFALYRTRVYDFPAVRTAPPYTAIHCPWYYTPENIPDDERYYINAFNTRQSCYSTILKHMVDKSNISKD